MKIPCNIANAQELKSALSHILWIGGATDSGKTTTAALLAEKYDFTVYHGDKTWREHWARVQVTQQPAMHLWDKMTMDERWLARTVEDLTEQTRQIMIEHLQFMIDDFLKMPKESKIIAEWFGFLPDCIVPLLTSPHQALWMIPNKDFKQASLEKRDKANFHRDTANPAKAWENHLARDLKLAEIMQEQAEEHQMHIIINDGNHSPEAVLALAERHFAPLLPEIS
jgi:2-phosphoglycerate kinase